MVAPVPCLVDPARRCSKKGYPYFYWRNPATGRKYYHAHATMLAQALGRDIRPGYHAAHKCGNPACWRVDPAHVYEATPQQNEADKRTDPPHAVYPVEFRPLPRPARIVPADYLPAIRPLIAAGYTIRQIAATVGLPFQTARRLVTNERKALRQLGG